MIPDYVYTQAGIIGLGQSNFYISNGDTCYLQGSSGLGIGLSGANIAFDGICSFTNTTTPIITNSIPANDATTKIPTTSWTNTYFGKKTLATGTTLQTWFGNNQFTSNTANLAISLQNTDATVYDGGLFISSVAGQANPLVTVGNTYQYQMELV